MAAYDFPDTAGRPSDGSFTYTAPDGTIYEWNGYAWQVPDSGNPGGGGGGNFEIPTQALPPAGAADGDMFWCTDDGRLYIYYEDADTSQWVDASPDNTSEAVDSYWAKSGSTLSPIDTADSVDIGDGKILLNADGSITAAGDVKATGFDVGEGATSDESFAAVNIFPAQAWAIKIEDDKVLGWGNSNSHITGNGTNNTLSFATNGNVIAELDVDSFNLGDIQNDDLHISLNADGSATFASNKLLVDNSGTLAIGPNLPGSAKVLIQNDGVAAFGGDQGVITLNYPGDLFQVKRPTTNPTESLARFVSNVGGSEINVISFDANGSATFSGGVTSAGHYVKSLAENGGVNISSGKCFIRQDGSNPVFQTVQGAGNTVTSSINGDGSATFAGGRCTVSKDGVIDIQAVSASANGSVLLRAGSANVTAGANAFVVKADGSGTFAGTVTANGNILTRNVELQIEADDDTKYTATTDSDGNQTLVYNGAVLDVKERIQNVISRMDAIEANEVTDDATDSALLTLVASLSSRLDERDATIAALTTRITTLEIQSNGGN